MSERGPAGHSLFRWLASHPPRCFWNEEREKDEIVTDRDVGLKSSPRIHTARRQHFIYGLSAARRHRAASILKTNLCLLRFLGGSQHLASISIFVVWKNYTARRRRRKNGFQKKKTKSLPTRLSHTASGTHTNPLGWTVYQQNRSKYIFVYIFLASRHVSLSPSDPYWFEAQKKARRRRELSTGDQMIISCWTGWKDVPHY